MNILLIPADDLNWDSVGCYGAAVPDATPHIDRLAREGMRFERAHVAAAVCMPSRAALGTGRYPHRNGIEGFRESLKADTPTLMGQLRQAGYRTGVVGKRGHSSPDPKHLWDLALDQGDLGHGRDPARYAEVVREFVRSDDRRPFYLMVNSHDPHRPFAGSDQEAAMWPGAVIAKPSRVYRPEEVVVPGFLPDLPEIRQEIAEYYSSVRRCDDSVGAIMAELDAAGLAESTLVMFLSDNGMALPFAKTNCYLHSTKTPWIVRLPGVVAPGVVDRVHGINGVDFMPTVLELVNLAIPEGTDGRSFLALLAGGQQAGRELICTQFHETAGRHRYPMRCMQDQRYGYIVSLWSDGERVFRNESQSGRTFAAMVAAAQRDPAIHARVNLFQHRVPEELYDFSNDPDCMHNLVAESAMAPIRDRLRASLCQWMEATGDPALSATRSGRHAEFMAKQ